MNDPVNKWSRVSLRHRRLTSKRNQGVGAEAFSVDHSGVESQRSSSPSRRPFSPLSLAFRAALTTTGSAAPTVNWAPRLQLTVQNHDHTHVDNRQSRSQSNTYRNSFRFGNWKPPSQVHRKGFVVADDHSTFTSVRRSRSVETRDLHRVDRVYRSPRVDSPTSAVVAPGRSTSTKSQSSASAVDMNKLDNELWNRFEKRIRVDRERRGKG